MDRGFVNLIRGNLPAYSRKARHFDLLRRYAGPRKVANLARAELSRLRGTVRAAGRPYVFTVDIGNVCNLRCPLCPTGVHELKRPQGFMSLEDFRAVLRKIEPWAIEVVLHNWGEPFLNPHFATMVREAHEAGIGTAASTNLNLERGGVEMMHEVVDAGLDHLVLSIDGTSQDVYEHYRRRGNLEHVLANVKELVSYKRDRGQRTPMVEWQFLAMKHNEHQIDEARRIGAELGVDSVRVTGAGLPFDDLDNLELAKEWMPEGEYRNYDPETIRSRGYLYDERCFYLYRAMTVNPQGQVAPCCALHHEEWDFGDLLADDLDEIWNNEHYRSARGLFSKNGTFHGLDTACHHCPLFKYECGDA